MVFVANDNFENKRNQFFFKSIKKGTKWVVHEQWTNEMKKVEHPHLYICFGRFKLCEDKNMINRYNSETTIVKGLKTVFHVTFMQRMALLE